MDSILIVEDEQSLRLALQRLLIDAGYHAIVASNVKEAIDYLKQESLQLVLSDINLPDGSGIELAQLLSSHYPEIGFVMMTAIDDPTVADVAIESGAYGYLTKPFGFNELLINIKNALRRRNLEIAHRKQHALLEQAVEERTRELQLRIEDLRVKDLELTQSREETIERLAKAAEFRDNETAEHVQRMSQYCGVLARRLGFSPERCESIRVASLLHDVGKIGIPDRILFKPGKLTDEEFAIIRSHCDIGYRILSDSKSQLLILGAEIALTHHERIDGKGYPRGLKGEDIPIEGRIAAIADVFDALSSKRVYKDAFSFEKSQTIMREGSGTQFDRELLDLFLDDLSDLEAIKQRYADGADPHLAQHAIPPEAR